MIIDIQSSSCTVSFDNYENKKVHSFIGLQVRTEEEPISSIYEHDILPPSLPSLPHITVLNFSKNNDSLSSILKADKNS